MRGLAVFAGILAVLLLLGLVRVGGSVEYSPDGISVWIRLGLLRLRLLPAKPRPKRPSRGKSVPKKRAPKKKPQKPKEDREKPKNRVGGPWELVRLYLPLACEAAGEMMSRIRIDRLYLDFISGGEAADAALNFGRVNAALGGLWPVLSAGFEIADHRFRTAVDFDAEGPTVCLLAAFSARIGQLVSFSFRFAVKALALYLEQKKEHKLTMAGNTKEGDM